MPISNPPLSVNFPEQEVNTTVGPTVEQEIAAGVSTQILQVNDFRRGLTIYNAHSAPVYFDVQPSVSNSKFMFVLEPGAFYEMLQPAINSGFHAITYSDESGKIHVREIRPVSSFG